MEKQTDWKPSTISHMESNGCDPNDYQYISKPEQVSYSEDDMIEASKYGYNFHKTTQFPNQEFEDSCINNTKQWFQSFKKK
tara:strand:+ start:424 stop:666 length:243 start_codon:yes stop_codon:yes gene_type:complete